MSIIRSTVIICITILVSVSMTLLYLYTEERFDIVKSKEGVFVFDRKTTSLNYCTKHSCRLISPRFIYKNSFERKFSSINPPMVNSPCSANVGTYAPPPPSMLPPPGYVMAQPWYSAGPSSFTSPLPKPQASEERAIKPLLPQTSTNLDTDNEENEEEDKPVQASESPADNTSDDDSED